MSELDEIQAALIAYSELPSQKQLVDRDSPLQELAISLNSGKDYILKVLSSRQYLEQEPISLDQSAKLSANPELPESSSVFYFQAHYPHKLSRVLHKDLQRLLEILNQLLPIGRLEILPELELVYRYTLLSEKTSEKTGLDSLLVLDVVLGIKGFLPAIFDWLEQVLLQSQSGRLSEALRQQFRQLLQILPSLTHPETTSALKSARVFPWRKLQLGVLGLTALLCLLWQPGVWTTLLALGTGLLSGRLYWLLHQEKAQRQLTFYSQLLEIETTRLAYQHHSMHQQRHYLDQRMAELEAQPIDYPADILRLRQQMMSLRQWQEQLQTREASVDLKHRELEQNRFELFKKQLRFKSAPKRLELFKLTPLDSKNDCPEDLLLQNFAHSLDYLGYEIQFRPHDAGFMQIQIPGSPLAVHLHWLQRWHQAHPRHSWMLYLDLPLPLKVSEASWLETQKILRLFSQYLPLGTLLYDFNHQQLSLRYQMLRLRGDLNPWLLIEALELLSSFGEHLQQRLRDYLTGHKSLELVLKESEQALEELFP